MKLHSNDPAGAIKILQPAVKYELANAHGLNNIYPAYIRGCAYLQLGDDRGAAAEFQKLLDHPGLVGREVMGALSHLQLARAQKMSGDDAVARKSYEEFLTLCKDADPDIPIYRQAMAEYARLLSQRKTAHPSTNSQLFPKGRNQEKRQLQRLDFFMPRSRLFMQDLFLIFLSYKRVGAIRAGQAQSHQSDVGPEATELGNSLGCIGSLPCKHHVGLGPYNRGQSLTKDRMVFNAQDANGIGPWHHDALARRLALDATGWKIFEH